MTWRTVLAVLPFVLVLGCQEEAGSGDEDAGITDAGEDAGGDAGGDTGGDAGDGGTVTDDGGESGDISGSDGDGEISEIDWTVDGRFRRSAPIAYPGLTAREVVVYLPEGYDQSQDDYPVLYLHDGQNLFNASEAAFGVEWQVDETVDRLTSEGVIEAHIVVGICNTPDRISDYTPDMDPEFGGGNGDAYADFVVELLKPVIDSSFRTRPERENTFLAGSSLGGIISLHIHQRHPLVFGGVGAVSPSLWWNDRSPIRNYEQFQGPQPQRLWLDMGTAEGEAGAELMPEPILNLRDLRALILERGFVPRDNFGYLEDPGAAHNESAWAGRLESVLWFLLSDTRPIGMTPGGLGLHLFHNWLDPDNGPLASSLSVEVVLQDRVRQTLLNPDTTLTSLDPLVATVDPEGIVTAVGPGTTRIQVEAEGHQASALLEVGSSPHTLVTFRVTVPPAPVTPPSDTITMTGSVLQLGNWDAGAVPMTADGTDTWTLSVFLPAGSEVEYKYTRGSWQTVEKAADGQEIPNRRLTPSGDTQEVVDTVAAWAG